MSARFGRGVGRHDLVRRRGQLLDPDRRLDVEADVEPVRLGLPGREVGIRHPLVARRVRPARVAWPDDGRIDELVGPVVGNQHLGVVHLHGDAIAGHDVRDVHREDVGALLLEQRGTLPLTARRLVAGAGGGATIDLRLDHARADLHPHPVHRGAGRGRKNVHRLDRRLAAVLEQLVHLHPRDDAGDRDVGGGLLQGKALGPRLGPILGRRAQHHQVGCEAAVVVGRRRLVVGRRERDVAGAARQLGQHLGRADRGGRGQGGRRPRPLDPRRRQAAKGRHQPDEFLTRAHHDHSSWTAGRSCPDPGEDARAARKI